ncbi:UDP-galactose-4-epimerase [Anopheles sinensis]|uniref:UDP-galactose-4-epimerase n=1 Tax=Anopheles sinensis TaxID=74873 RepID=A0A084WQP6_ANOSI|nr:UDP-galactose-4-epimerase [Anopheles sinensis]
MCPSASLGREHTSTGAFREVDGTSYRSSASDRSHCTDLAAVRGYFLELIRARGCAIERSGRGSGRVRLALGPVGGRRTGWGVGADGMLAGPEPQDLCARWLEESEAVQAAPFSSDSNVQNIRSERACCSECAWCPAKNQRGREGFAIIVYIVPFCSVGILQEKLSVKSLGPFSAIRVRACVPV